MKNTACDIYLGDEELAYQQAFGYIRQLAIHLRNSMKVKTKVGQQIDSSKGTQLTASVVRKHTSRCIIGNLFIASTSGHSSCHELARRKRRSNPEKRANSKRLYTLLFRWLREQSSKSYINYLILAKAPIDLYRCLAISHCTSTSCDRSLLSSSIHKPTSRSRRTC